MIEPLCHKVRARACTCHQSLRRSSSENVHPALCIPLCVLAQSLCLHMGAIPQMQHVRPPHPLAPPPFSPCSHLDAIIWRMTMSLRLPPDMASISTYIEPRMPSRLDRSDAPMPRIATMLLHGCGCARVHVRMCARVCVRMHAACLTARTCAREGRNCMLVWGKADRHARQAAGAVPKDDALLEDTHSRCEAPVATLRELPTQKLAVPPWFAPYNSLRTRSKGTASFCAESDFANPHENVCKHVGALGFHAGTHSAECWPRHTVRAPADTLWSNGMQAPAGTLRQRRHSRCGAPALTLCQRRHSRCGARAGTLCQRRHSRCVSVGTHAVEHQQAHQPRLLLLLVSLIPVACCDPSSMDFACFACANPPSVAHSLATPSIAPLSLLRPGRRSFCVDTHNSRSCMCAHAC